MDLTFVNNERIHELNLEYRGIDRPTDVLSFAMNEAGEDELEIKYDLADEDEELEEVPNVLGDIIISVTRAQEQAEEYGHSLERSWASCSCTGSCICWAMIIRSRRLRPK